MQDLRLHVIPLSDAEKDSKGHYLNACNVSPQQFAALVERANVTYAGTNIRFAFNPALDWAPMADTGLNSDAPDMRQRGNDIAALFPGEIVCFLRWGNLKDNNGIPIPTGNGNAYPPPGAGPKPPDVDDVVQNYVALPNQIYDGSYSYLNLGNGSFVAHELGHYLS